MKQMFRIETIVKHKKCKIFFEGMEKINKVLAALIKEKGVKYAEVARKIGDYTGQAIGNYARGKRTIPTDFVTKWKKEYGEDLINLAETGRETVVSHETSGRHLIEDGNYIGLHRLAWSEFQETLRHSRKMLNDAAKTSAEVVKNNTSLTKDITKLVNILAKTSGD